MQSVLGSSSSLLPRVAGRRFLVSAALRRDTCAIGRRDPLMARFDALSINDVNMSDIGAGVLRPPTPRLRDSAAEDFAGGSRRLDSRLARPRRRSPHSSNGHLVRHHHNATRFPAAFSLTPPNPAGSEAFRGAERGRLACASPPPPAHDYGCDSREGLNDPSLVRLPQAPSQLSVTPKVEAMTAITALSLCLFGNAASSCRVSLMSLVLACFAPAKQAKPQPRLREGTVYDPSPSNSADASPVGHDCRCVCRAGHFRLWTATQDAGSHRDGGR